MIRVRLIVLKEETVSSASESTFTPVIPFVDRSFSLLTICSRKKPKGFFLLLIDLSKSFYFQFPEPRATFSNWLPRDSSFTFGGWQHIRAECDVTVLEPSHSFQSFYTHLVTFGRILTRDFKGPVFSDPTDTSHT